jgi:hypothetical protein
MRNEERQTMLTQPTIEKLCAMRLKGMAEAFRQQQESADCQRLSFEERLGLLIDRQWTWRENHALERRLRNGRLQGPACIEDIDYRTARGLDRQLVRSLTQESVWVRERQNLFLLGPTGIGKTWLGRAFAQKACRDGYTAFFYKAAELFRDLAMARADGRHAKLLYNSGEPICSSWMTGRWRRWRRRNGVTFWRSAMRGIRHDPLCSPVRFRWRAGMRRSAIRLSLIPSWTVLFTTLIASN